MPDAEAEDFARLYRPENGQLGGPALYEAQHSDTAFLTDETIKALDVRKAKPWTAFVTFIRPHPPYVAPAPYHAYIDPMSIPAPLATRSAHPFLTAWRNHPSNAGLFWGYDGASEQLSDQTVALVRATYLGLVAELDAHIGRLLDWLDATGQKDRTAIVFTADHGDMLGDFGMWGQVSPFPQASRVPFLMSGPEIEGGDVAHVTQSTEVMVAVLRYLYGPKPRFNGIGPGKSARVELSLSSPSKPTPWEKAGLVTRDQAACVVKFDATSRTASFDARVGDLAMDPADGYPC